MTHGEGHVLSVFILLVLRLLVERGRTANLFLHQRQKCLVRCLALLLEADQRELQGEHSHLSGHNIGGE